MPGQIKIDDGAGNYTILTNAGSLGSDKTITIPNTTGTVALTSDITSGLTEADMWYLTANVTSNGDITSNLSRQSGTLVSKIGTGMTESSGIFTFPNTGYWLVTARTLAINISGDTITCFIVATNDNFSTEANVGIAKFGSNSSTSPTGGTGYGEVILDIQDVSNDKVKFLASSITSGSYLTGGTQPDATNFSFIRLGDT